MEHYSVVIVGAGQAGAIASLMLRQSDFQGSIAIVGAEPELPYERPFLSKDYLFGEKTFERMLIRPPIAYEERRIEMLLNRRIVAVDSVAKVITDSDGNDISYDDLIWATGGKPRSLTCDGHKLVGVHTVRDRRDVDRMRGEIDSVETAVVVGGGYIGLEAAAVLRKLNKKVVLLEALDRVLARVAGEPLSRFFEDFHRSQGVDIWLNSQVECILGEDKVEGVRLANGEVVKCQMVIVGIGILPEVEPLLAAGAAGGNGVDVDEQCRTSLPHIYAVGDCARHPNRYALGQMIRLESVQNANDQAAVAAKTIAGVEATYDSLPWFWSDQYDLRLQTVGLSIDYDSIVVRGDTASLSFSVIYLREGAVVAMDCVNATRDFAHGRKAVTDGLIVTPEKLADTSITIKDMIQGR